VAAIGDPREVLASASLIYGADEVARALDFMATAAASEVAAKNPIVLAVMNGGAFIATELCRRFVFPYEFDYVHATRYGKNLTGGALDWKVPPSQRLRGRVVLVVDDVLDRGDTLAALLERIDAVGAREVLVAVLVEKRLDTPARRPQVDFVGLTSDDVYLFGSGMDYAGYWRGLPGLYGLRS
jgi:hypoxanthine phosphoribosyltransferase